MNVLFDEDGSFKVASILSEANGSLQVEDPRGKRIKIKAAHVLLRFSGDGWAELPSRAETLADDIDTDLLWQCAPAEEFSFVSVAAEYFGDKPTPEQQAATLMALHRAPVYFYRKGRGQYKAAPEENVRAALAGLEKRKQQQAQIDAWAEQLSRGELPPGWSELLYVLLHKPDKNTLEYKALEAAANALNMPPQKVFERCGALQDTQRYHYSAFLLEHFPRGTEFPEVGDLPPLPELELADVQAFSIDDAATTEIDDAFSLKTLANGHREVGIHIAAPALGVLPDSALDAVVKQRLSTVYMPGDKITMLPDALVQQFTLAEGEARPALSLYVEVDAEWKIVNTRTRLNRVPVVANLRHDALEAVFNEDTLRNDPGVDYAFKDELNFLWRFACALEKGRGVDENQPQRLDYNFYVENDRVSIVARKRGAPMDKLVSELMILTNSEWGRQLKEANIPAIYRAQSAGKVRMTTEAAPHVGLGLAQYAWSSSPLRRAVDMVNQRQLISWVQGQPPVYPKNSPFLFAVMRDFDQTYSAYAEYQGRMERYWTLRWLQQENVSELHGHIWREGLVRIDGLPLVLRVGGLSDKALGSRVHLKLLRLDFLQLEAEVQVLETVAVAEATP